MNLVRVDFDRAHSARHLSGEPSEGHVLLLIGHSSTPGPRLSRTDLVAWQRAASVTLATLPGGQVRAALGRILLGVDLVFADSGAVIELGSDVERMRILDRLSAVAAPFALPYIKKWSGNEISVPDLGRWGVLAGTSTDAVDEATAVAVGLAAQSALAVRLTRDITARPGTLRQHLAWESMAQGQCLVSPEHLEGTVRYSD